MRIYNMHFLVMKLLCVHKYTGLKLPLTSYFVDLKTQKLELKLKCSAYTFFGTFGDEIIHNIINNL